MVDNAPIAVNQVGFTQFADVQLANLFADALKLQVEAAR